MKFHSLYAFLVYAVFAPILLLSCGGGDEETTETPTVQYINLRSCSVADGAEYSAPDLKEITLSYGRVVSVSSSANITLNGVSLNTCAASTSDGSFFVFGMYSSLHFNTSLRILSFYCTIL